MSARTLDVASPDSTAELATRFRDTMAQVVTPVAIVTAADDDGPHGTTVSAFASLSMEPPMVLVSLDRSSALLEVIHGSGRFGVNILGADHEHLARLFARKAADRFAEVDWAQSDRLPRLTAAPGWIACDEAVFLDGGDHEIVVGIVRAAEHRVADPLTYHSRGFGTHVAAPAAS